MEGNLKVSELCEQHQAKRELICLTCNEYYCQKCFISHLQTKHKVNFISHIDNAIDQIKSKFQDKITEIIVIVLNYLLYFKL